MYCLWGYIMRSVMVRSPEATYSGVLVWESRAPAGSGSGGASFADIRSDYHYGTEDGPEELTAAVAGGDGIC